MQKRKSIEQRPNEHEMPTGATCKGCSGSGAKRGVFFRYTCDECGGSGLSSTDQKYFISKEDELASMCIALKKRVAELERINAQLVTERHIGSRFD